MNEQEAIEFIKNSDTLRVTNKKATEAVRLSLEALEKQVVKKPVYSDFSDNGFDEIIPYKAECPVCGYEFEFGKWNDEESHHCICGQKMDWSDEE